MVDTLPALLILALFVILGAVLVHVMLLLKTYLSKERVRILQDDDGWYVVQRGKFLLYNHPTFFDQYSVANRVMLGGHRWSHSHTKEDRTCEDIETAIAIKEYQMQKWEEEKKARKRNKNMKVVV